VILDRMASDLVLSRDYLWQIVRTASHRYKRYPIQKRTGGERIIYHPAKELKLLQYWLLKNVFPRLRVHDSAMAYRPRRNIREHAAQHSHQNYLLKIDFRDFFPSIGRRDVLRVLQEHADALDGLLESDEDREMVSRIVCRDGQLTIGAPTSPILSNAVMFNFDTHWAARSRELGVVYSRYADDLYFSTVQQNVLGAAFAELREYLRQMQSPVLQINDRKTAFSSKKRRRLITGLVLTPTRNISLGRQRKRHMKSLVFQFVSGRLSARETESLRGLIAYAASVEPPFVAALKRKYGPRSLDLF
jgi:RNA-directed DNA polymerase